MPITVAIYEDNSALREALIILIKGLESFTLVGAHGDCNEIEAQLHFTQPDVILMDIDLPGRSGIEGAYIVKQISPSTEVLMLTVFDEDEKVFNALCAGASGYLLKKTPPSKILEAIEEVYSGGAPMSPVIARKVLQLFPKKPAVNLELDKLTSREQEVLTSLAKGNSYKMVATELNISIDTVRTHIKRIYEKMHVHSVAEAINKAFLKK
ncbi:MAG: response regulator transcription factor [Haliscomenobacter sp.]|uniref:response regulator transcription factor n=1 Tax=Haliscomenobacter sp. TaxID=2717303 RepID=UPI0029AC8C93|nr:response regulator transcription factor [Haliscomenobacter sp.]MDX2072705.1 response regulator transcription factor [Haliscomenobacter sp.]